MKMRNLFERSVGCLLAACLALACIAAVSVGLLVVYKAGLWIFQLIK